MVNHCANPVCNKSLHYLRDGKVFLFSHKQRENSNSSTKARLEHYWLCGTCANQWTLAADGTEGIKLVEMRRRRFRASYLIPYAVPAS